MNAAAPVVLVLASGRGERFIASGGHGNKLSALLAGRTVLEWTLAAVRASDLPWYLEDAGPQVRPGMGDSIAAAVRATASAPGWLVLPGDLPLIQPASLRRVADELTRQPAARVVRPFYVGAHGHPVGFAAACRDALLDLKGNQGAARVVHAQAAINLVANVALDDAGCVTDIDTVADLVRAEALLARGRVPFTGFLTKPHD